MNEHQSLRQSAVGIGWALALVVLLAAVMLPLRNHLSVATTALVLVVPVVTGVARGGFPAGIAATACGFLAYDVLFIKPYGTLNVGAAENWVALAVYVVVMVIVARVVAQVNGARAEEQRRSAELRRLFDLTELLVREAPVSDLLDTIVTSVVQAFHLDGAALLLPRDGRLSPVAFSGLPPSDKDLERLDTVAPGLVSLGSDVLDRDGMQVVALAASGEAIGLLALRGLAVGRAQLELLRAFANHLALALERSGLREQAVRAALLEEVDRLRRSLVGAVSHDLRTPLATIKVATSTLLDPEATLAAGDVHELVGLVDSQADRLDRLVANLLDMTRIQSGTLELRLGTVTVAQLLADAVASLGSSADVARLRHRLDPRLPLVEVDQVLIGQVLANLIDNALRHTPEDGLVTVSARSRPDRRVEVAVTDEGSGVAAEEWRSIFQMSNRREAGGRGGLGLAIAKAFVEAHGEQIWVTAGESGRGARFAFSLPISSAQHAPSTPETRPRSDSSAGNPGGRR